MRPPIVSLVVVTAVACGSRTGLEARVGPSSAETPDGDVVPPDGDVVSVPVCHSWVATHDPVQVSDIASIIQVVSAIPAPSGVLVGYADAQFPPVDPSWHERLVSFGDGTLGPEQTPFRRDTSGLDWTAISLALGRGIGAASASDQTQGMQFVSIDSSGVPTGSVTTIPGEPGRYLLSTSTGFSVLQSAFNESGERTPPVALAMLDPSGAILSRTTVLDAATSVDGYSRSGFADGSFMLVWETSEGTSGASVISARHFAEDGTTLGPPATLHTFGADSFGGSYTIAPTSRGFLSTWYEKDGGHYDLVGEPFDENGRSAGASTRFAVDSGGPVMALATAPGGDLLAAWDDASESEGRVYVQALAADGSAEGDPTMLGSIASPESDLFVVASPLGAMVLYENDTPSNVEVFAIPLACAE